MNVILIGFMATGKSTIGRALGRLLDAPFIDMDREIRNQYDLSIAEIFEQHGEEAFRHAETRLLELLLHEKNLRVSQSRQYPRRFVLSTGGGTPLREENQPLLKEIGYVVWLRAQIETIADRCRPHIPKRPLLVGHEADLEEHIKGLLIKREPLYESCADATVWTDDVSTPETIAQRIKREMGVHAREI